MKRNLVFICTGAAVALALALGFLLGYKLYRHETGQDEQIKRLSGELSLVKGRLTNPVEWSGGGSITCL